jgi:hypothetical protein
MSDSMTINNIIDFIKNKSYINANNQINIYNYTFKSNINEFNKFGNNYFNIFKDKFNNVIINDSNIIINYNNLHFIINLYNVNDNANDNANDIYWYIVIRN